MATLSIDQAPQPSSGGAFSGTVDLSSERGRTYADFAVFPFIWTESAGIRGWPRGWKPATSNPIPLTHDNSWYIHVAPARQYAAVLVYADFGLGFDPGEPFAPGTLPMNAVEHVRVMAHKRVVILTVPDDPLTGLVTGYPCALYDPQRLSPEPPAEEELLKIVAWSRTKGQPRYLGPARCEPSGYWTFSELDQDARDADEYFVALTPRTYEPGDNLPVIGGDVWEMDWKPHTPRPPLVLAAGQSFRP